MLMGMAAEKKGLDLAGTRMEVAVESAPSQGGRLQALRAVIHLPRKVSEEQLKDLQAAVERCPLRQSLRAEVQVSVEFVAPA